MRFPRLNIALALALSATASHALAQNYPVRPVRLIIPFLRTCKPPALQSGGSPIRA